MLDHPVLTAEEWALIVDLLLLEERKLPVEIHHVQNAERRRHLQHRLQVVEGLFARLRPAAVSATP